MGIFGEVWNAFEGQMKKTAEQKRGLYDLVDSGNYYDLNRDIEFFQDTGQIGYDLKRLLKDMERKYNFNGSVKWIVNMLEDRYIH